MKTRKFISYVFLFIILIILELALLTGVSLIPKESIRKNVRISAEYLYEKAPFYRLVPTDTASMIDRHADAILLNLAWSCDSENPLRSVLRSSYYHDKYANENTNLLYAVSHDATPTYEYMRYWHGSLVVLRPLLVVFSLQQIYVLGGVVFAILFLIGAFCLYRNYGKGPLWGFLFSACTCSVWYVPLSLEYMPAFLIGFTSIPITDALLKKHPQKLGYLFFTLGSLTAYTDFLTTETITCLLPLVLILMSNHRQNEKPISTCIKSGLLWLTGYGCTWISKWFLYSVIIGKNGFSDALTQTAYRTGGEAVPDGLYSQMVGALLRNLRCLFPFSLLKDPSGMVTAVLILLLTGMVFWLIRKQKHMPVTLSAFWLIGLLPYFRYAVLSNHAYIHYFFTYRAQFTSMYCLFLIFWFGTDTEFLKKEWKKIRKRK